ncbi:MAG: zinc-binding dehydrogenase [Anaerolineales bacterium]|nr:zinc-binding dehydrogenase [Anaerolineales bacterium]
MTNNGTLRRAIITAPQAIQFEELPVPEPGPDEVLVEVRACAICTWEKRAFTGADTRFYPLVGGHEIAGVVAAIGQRAGDGLAVGDRVAVSGLTRCGKCYSCRRGRDNRCENTWQRDMVPGQPIGPGGFATYKLGSDYQIFRLGADTDFVEGALTEPLACVVRSVKRARVAPGDFVVVMGGGVMGALHVLLAKRQGATVVVSEPDAGRRQRLEALGADCVVDAAATDLRALVKDMTRGHGAEVVFDAVGMGPNLETGLQLVGNGGRVMVYARVYPKGTTIKMDPNLFHEKEIVLTGSMSQNREDFMQAAEMIVRRTADLRPLISGIYPMDQLVEAFEASTRLENYRIVVTM